MLRAFVTALALTLSWSERSSAQAEPAPAAPAATVEHSFAPPPPARGQDPNDPRPSSGVGLVVAGWIATGVGLLNFAVLPLCSADFYPPDQEDFCVGVQVGVGSVGLLVGIPLLIIGYNQRADYKAWKTRNYGAAHDGLGLSLQSDRFLLSYRGSL
jgi:hypothetical protein